MWRDTSRFSLVFSRRVVFVSVLWSNNKAHFFNFPQISKFTKTYISSHSNTLTISFSIFTFFTELITLYLYCSLNTLMLSKSLLRLFLKIEKKLSCLVKIHSLKDFQSDKTDLDFQFSAPEGFHWSPSRDRTIKPLFLIFLQITKL